ncbi:kelch repeat protein [Colletotrichum salicis]|uniref:Kelch repeat protein n=1 Tax=Colletotrichum salicis TaxID=1209931 RepID=A0A135V919_9PEZI|nr:kelch repeat protein [Colletotrichum salicis]
MFLSPAVLGDYAYIDSREASQLDARGNPITSRGSNTGQFFNEEAINPDTFSCATNTSKLHTIDQFDDVMAMWKNNAKNTFWIWGGHRPFGTPLDEPTSWKFKADGKGRDTWSKETPANPTLFQELRRNEGGTFTSTPDAGFWFGGQSSGWTTSNPYSQPLPGILSYNMTTRSWANETNDACSKYGTLTGGSAIYIPTFGPNGLIIIMGSATWGLESDQAKPLGWQDFSNLTFMDPVTRDCYWQKTTGNAPTPRSNFCSVGVEGNNGTYEILFDMTDWTWKTDYDADAKDYESAKPVGDWYQQTGVNSVQWSSNEVQALFRKSNSNTTGEINQDPSGDEDAKGSAPIAAIVGADVGAVVGAIIGFALFCFIRRRKQRKTAEAATALAPYSDHSKDNGAYQAYYQPVAPGELHLDVSQNELYGGSIPKHEMWAKVLKHEMGASGVHHYTVTELYSHNTLLGHGDRDHSKVRRDLQ